MEFLVSMCVSPLKELTTICSSNIPFPDMSLLILDSHYMDFIKPLPVTFILWKFNCWGQGHMHTTAHLWRWEDNSCNQFFPALLWGFQRSNSGHLAWWQVPWAILPSSFAVFIAFVHDLPQFSSLPSRYFLVVASASSARLPNLALVLPLAYLLSLHSFWNTPSCQVTPQAHSYRC